MSITIATGKISHLDHSTETSGYTTPSHGGQIRTSHAWSFRLNNVPAIYQNRLTASFSDGDELTAAGMNKDGTFRILSCRNETTGATYLQPAMLLNFGAIFLIVLSVPLLLIYVGVLSLAFGIYLLTWGRRMSKANSLLLATPRLQPA